MQVPRQVDFLGVPVEKMVNKATELLSATKSQIISREESLPSECPLNLPS